MWVDVVQIAFGGFDLAKRDGIGWKPAIGSDARRGGGGESRVVVSGKRLKFIRSISRWLGRYPRQKLTEVKKGERERERQEAIGEE